MKEGYEWCKEVCKAEFGKIGVGEDAVAVMIEAAKLKRQKNQHLLRVYEHRQEIKDKKQKISDIESS